MTKPLQFRFVFIIAITFLFACNAAITENETHSQEQELPGSSQQYLEDSFKLSSQDVQYLDLMIPQDAMVEIYYSVNQAGQEYIAALKEYLKTKHAVITVYQTKNFPQDIKPVGRLYIHDTGDHRYVLYIF
ncbi:MAG: hypothetical protein QM763_12240 [Agriterribacter sp.]